MLDSHLPRIIIHIPANKGRGARNGVSILFTGVGACNSECSNCKALKSLR